MARNRRGLDLWDGRLIGCDLELAALIVSLSGTDDGGKPVVINETASVSIADAPQYSSKRLHV